jgi:hypothetical protein
MLIKGKYQYLVTCSWLKKYHGLIRFLGFPYQSLTLLIVLREVIE